MATNFDNFDQLAKNELSIAFDWLTDGVLSINFDYPPESKLTFEQLTIERSDYYELTH